MTMALETKYKYIQYYIYFASVQCLYFQWYIHMIAQRQAV